MSPRDLPTKQRSVQVNGVHVETSDSPGGAVAACLQLDGSDLVVLYHAVRLRQ